MFKRFFKKSQSIDKENVPKHVAIIMDGNGRWAKQRGLPRIAGHHSGMKNVKRIALFANQLGVQYLTLYAFSTENWKRPKDEVDFLMRLPQEFLSIELKDLMKNNIQVQMMGYPDDLPKFTFKAVSEAIEKTKNNTGLVLNFALNYGGRQEIINSVIKITKQALANQISISDIDESLFCQQLLSQHLPDPDLLIRTSGELRVSNFMLWQIAYSELYFSKVYWPDFKQDDFTQAILDYQQRMRRYGGL